MIIVKDTLDYFLLTVKGGCGLTTYNSAVNEDCEKIIWIGFAYSDK